MNGHPPLGISSSDYDDSVDYLALDFDDFFPLYGQLPSSFFVAYITGTYYFCCLFFMKGHWEMSSDELIWEWSNVDSICGDVSVYFFANRFFKACIFVWKVTNFKLIIRV